MNFQKYIELTEAFDQEPYAFTYSAKSNTTDQYYTFEDESGHSFRVWFEVQKNLGKKVERIKIGQAVPAMKVYKKIIQKFKNPLKVIATIIDIFKYQTSENSVGMQQKGFAFAIPAELFGSYFLLCKKLIEKSIKPKYVYSKIQYSNPEEKEFVYLVFHRAGLNPNSVFDGDLFDQANKIEAQNDTDLDVVVPANTSVESPKFFILKGVGVRIGDIMRILPTSPWYKHFECSSGLVVIEDITNPKGDNVWKQIEIKSFVPTNTGVYVNRVITEEVAHTLFNMNIQQFYNKIQANNFIKAEKDNSVQSKDSPQVASFKKMYPIGSVIRLDKNNITANMNIMFQESALIAKIVGHRFPADQTSTDLFDIVVEPYLGIGHPPTYIDKNAVYKKDLTQDYISKTLKSINKTVPIENITKQWTAATEEPKKIYKAVEISKKFTNSLNPDSMDPTVLKFLLENPPVTIDNKPIIDPTPAVADLDTYNKLKDNSLMIGPVKIEFQQSFRKNFNLFREMKTEFGIADNNLRPKVEHFVRLHRRLTEKWYWDFIEETNSQINTNIKSVQAYTGNSYSGINKMLRGNVADPEYKSEYHIKNVDKCFDKDGIRLPDNIEIFRGQSMPQKQIDDLINGQLYKMHAFTSCSSSLEVAIGFLKRASSSAKLFSLDSEPVMSGDGKYPVLLSIRNMSNTLAIMPGHKSNHVTEQEIILNRGTTLKLDPDGGWEKHPSGLYSIDCIVDGVSTSIHESEEKSQPLLFDDFNKQATKKNEKNNRISLTLLYEETKTEPDELDADEFGYRFCEDEQAI